MEEIVDTLRTAMEYDPGDFFEYVIGQSVMNLDNALYGGFRFPVECRLAGRRFAHFKIDVAAGDVRLEDHETVKGGDWLGFAGLLAPEVPVISMEQQMAEKLHSYTLPRQTPNSRVKDLVDMVLLLEKGVINPERFGVTLKKTFARRKSHPIPSDLKYPPPEWEKKFAALAAECGIPGAMDEAFEAVRGFYKAG